MAINIDQLLADCTLFFLAAFMKLTGYTWDECIGRNCRFLQGLRTESDAVQVIREGIHQSEAICVCITNYTKSGKPFRNLLSMKPVFEYKSVEDEAQKRNGVPRYYIGIQHSIPVLNRHSTAREAQARFVEIDALIQLIPATIIVPRPAYLTGSEVSVDLEMSTSGCSSKVTVCEEE